MMRLVKRIAKIVGILGIGTIMVSSASAHDKDPVLSAFSKILNFGKSVVSRLTTPSGQRSTSRTIRHSAVLPERVACDAALSENTIESLENFLWKYPDGDLSCRKRVRSALDLYMGSFFDHEKSTTAGYETESFGGYGG
jgi:hypothetical protein